MAILALSMQSIPSILSVAIGLGFVIFIHELGHFAVAKWCDVNVERFSIGFGPVIWARTWGETEYALSLIPFGGYVKMLGQDDIDPSQETDEEIALDPRSYTAKSVPQRMAIISAGVIMNLVTSVLFFLFAFKLGVEYTPAVVGQTIPGGPAWTAGLRTGDELTEINDRRDAPLSYLDIRQEVALSDSDVHVKGIRKFYDGVTVREEEFEAALTPETSGLIPLVGIKPTTGLSLPGRQEGKGAFVSPGSPADHATPPLEGGDEITKVDEVDINSWADLQNALTRRRNQEVTLTVKRAQSDLQTKIAPNYFRTLGLKMDIGPITGIQQGSPASRAEPPLQVNDKITHVISNAEGEREVGTDIDALRLPDYLASLHGKEITIRVRRETSGKEESKDCVLVPDDRPGWMERPSSGSEPLTVPAIGIAYHVMPFVLKVEEGSPAFGEIKSSDKRISIKSIEFFPPIGKELQKMELENKDGTPVNWAFAFWLMQLYPDRTVSIEYSEQGSKKPMTTAKLQPKAQKTAGHEWYSPIRGISLNRLVKQRQAETYGESLRMAYTRTRSSLLEIYFTLKSLFSGRVSPKALRGPLGIAEAAFLYSERGTGDLLWFVGFLSVNLAVLNFLPIPVLDGGHMVFLIWEGIRGKPASERVLIAANYVGLGFVLCLMLWVLSLDIIHLLGWW